MLSRRWKYEGQVTPLTLSNEIHETSQCILSLVLSYYSFVGIILLSLTYPHMYALLYPHPPMYLADNARASGDHRPPCFCPRSRQRPRNAHQRDFRGKPL